MNWFILALLAPLAWSIANYLDKFILSKSRGGEGGSGGLLIVTSLASLIVALVIGIVFGAELNTDSQHAGALVLSGMLEALYLLFYFYALEEESTTTVISLFQFAPIFGLIFGYLILNEVPTGLQLMAVLIVLAGTLCIVIKKGERFRMNMNVVLLMLVSTAFVGIYNTIFKLAGENIDFWAAVFWQYLGIGAVGFLLYFGVPAYRRQFHTMLTRRGPGVLGMTAGAEFMNVVALVATNAAVLLAPVALVLSVSSVQPIFVLIEGFIIMHFLPNFLDPTERPQLHMRYLFGILLVCVGGFLIYQ
jgi:drug/metabolite transporter (DMT)-like permease